jgi:hypothetical protein
MSKKVQRISHLLKVANEGNYLLNSTHTGVLHVHRNKNKEWGYVYVNKELFMQRRADALGEAISDWKVPDILPHISIFTKEEVKLIPGDFKIPSKIEYTLTGDIKIIKPKDWVGVSDCVFEVVLCKEIIEIRKKLGFPAYMFNDHEFHITLGIKKDLTKKRHVVD